MESEIQFEIPIDNIIDLDKFTRNSGYLEISADKSVNLKDDESDWVGIGSDPIWNIFFPCYIIACMVFILCYCILCAKWIHDGSHNESINLDSEMNCQSNRTDSCLPNYTLVTELPTYEAAMRTDAQLDKQNPPPPYSVVNDINHQQRVFHIFNENDYPSRKKLSVNKVEI